MRSVSDTLLLAAAGKTTGPPISYIGEASATYPTSTTVAPTHQIGDLLIVISSVATSRPFPDLAGFSTLMSFGNFNFSNGTIKVQYRTAASTSYTLNPWGDTNYGADQATILVYRAPTIGASAFTTAGGSTYPALTFNNANNTSWGLRIFGRGAENGFNTPAPGFTLRKQQYFCVISDSNSTISSLTANLVSGVGTSHNAASIELKV
jgi:hypothetical protein